VNRLVYDDQMLFAGILHEDTPSTLTALRRDFAVMLVLAALAFAGGYWELAIARSASPRI
jgi:hypothetical protein